MGMHSVESGYDTTPVTGRPDRALIEHRMRVLLSTIACEMFDVPVPDHIDENTVIPQTPESRAARTWRNEMYRLLDLTIPEADTEPEPSPAPTAPAANPTGDARVIATIRHHDGDGTWRKQGNCTDRNAELFHPLSEDGPAADAQIEEAKAVCRGCPVLDKCQSYALDISNQVFHGVVGGMSARERRAVWDRQKHLVRAAA